MTWDNVMNLINNGFFPIVMCGGLIYALITIFKAYRDDSKATTEAVNNNTLALNRIADKLDAKEGSKK
jgi:hypothetical protein